tara:strand:+ start:836 stop:2311 length:1476 start_codon:yes stop_codon:yes gene_type:complete
MKTLSKILLGKIFLNPNFNFLTIKNQNFWKHYTYRELYSHICHTRKILENMNIEKGDRIAYKGDNSLNWISWNIAVNSLGAVWVPMYNNQNLNYCKNIIKDCSPKLLLTDDINIDINVDKINYNYNIEKFYTFEEEFHCEDNELATLIYTSGTTGGPKGVMLSNNNILSNIRGIHNRFKERPSSTSLNILPWAHIYSQTCELYYNMIHNHRTVISSNKEKFLKECKEIKPDTLYLVPRVLDVIKEKLQFLDKPIIKVILPYILNYLLGGNVKTIFLGGAKLNEDTKQFFVENNITLCEGYGSTETSPIICVNNVKGSRNINSIGKILDDIKVEIVDNEIQVSGPNIMIGYWNNQLASDEVLINRDNNIWYKTGDKGSIDNQGFMYYQGRISENYKLSNGKFVDVSELEHNIKKYVKGNFVVFGENMKYNNLITDENISNEKLKQINNSLDSYLKIDNVIQISKEEFNNFLTPKMSIKRNEIINYILNKINN